MQKQRSNVFIGLTAAALLLPLGCGGGGGTKATPRVTLRGVVVDAWPAGKPLSHIGISFAFSRFPGPIPMGSVTPVEDIIVPVTTDAEGRFTASLPLYRFYPNNPFPAPVTYYGYNVYVAGDRSKTIYGQVSITPQGVDEASFDINDYNKDKFGGDEGFANAVVQAKETARQYNVDIAVGHFASP